LFSFLFLFELLRPVRERALENKNSNENKNKNEIRGA